MPAAVVQAVSAWPMSLASVPFFLLLPLALGGAFVLPAKLRRPFLLLCSYVFYLLAAPRYLPVLLFGTLLSWLLGLFVSAAGAPAARRRRCGIGVALLVLFLCFFKYNAFFEGFVAPLFDAVHLPWPQDFFIAAKALGISFYTFTSIAYLVDVSRGDVPAEKNLLNYALFLGFFPSVSQGPISRAGQLLPQLKDDTRRFDVAAAPDALRLFALGLFKKLAVADTIKVFTDAVYGNLSAYTGLTLTLAALAFAVQLYFDFAGYTDMARAAALLLGIKLPQNFRHPFYSTNYSAFWARWHMSLSAFLQDYVFTPLVWSRWHEKLPLIGKRVTKPPVLSAIAAVFLISGIWHGDTLCFVVWGALQAVFRIGEELLHRFVGKPKKNPPLLVRLGKNAVVLVLWVESLVFFRVGYPDGGTVADAFSALVRQFSGISLAGAGQDIFAAAQTGFYGDTRIAATFIGFSLVCTLLALMADWLECFRLQNRPLQTALGTLKAAPRWLLYFLLAGGCFAGLIAASGGFGGTSFLYGGF